MTASIIGFVAGVGGMVVPEPSSTALGYIAAGEGLTSIVQGFNTNPEKITIREHKKK